MADENEREVLIDALANARNRQFAEWFVIAFSLAAETHPDQIRKALATLFDLSAVEDSSNRLMVSLADAQARAGDVRARLLQAGLEATRVEARLEEVDRRMDRAAQFINRLAKYVKQIHDQQKASK